MADEKVMAEDSRKAGPVKVKTVKLMLDGKMNEYSINGRLPEGFLRSKLKENQRYIPIHLYRDIMRQIGEFGIPDFSEPEKFINGKNKAGIDMITYKVRCTIEHTVGKKIILLKGSGYASM